MVHESACYKYGTRIKQLVGGWKPHLLAYKVERDDADCGQNQFLFFITKTQYHVFIIKNVQSVTELM